MLKRLALILLILPLQALADPAQDTDQSSSQETAVKWLEKMGVSKREQSYAGTYIYMRGKRFDTMQVVHQNLDGKEIERLTNASGAERQIIRHDDHAVCIHPGGDSTIPHALPHGPFTNSFNRNLTENLSNYTIGMHGVGRIANRPAVRISISPKNNDRYGYRLWLDQETGLLLRSNLVNNGRVLELFQFTDISIGGPIAPELLTASIRGEDVFEHELLEPKNVVAQAAKQPPPNWRVKWMPRGFRQVSAQKGDGMVFTDGVATLSVFVEKRGRNSLGDVQTTIGGTVVLSRPIEGSAEQITVVGEVPLATAKRVAESIEPVIY
ncbi:MAG: sigma-E factor negative regulatory protein RseB [Candidatus Azotimanducaceae bacterium]|jgi:sigma-E factor negative regulatory protein RseB